MAQNGHPSLAQAWQLSGQERTRQSVIGAAVMRTGGSYWRGWPIISAVGC
jgi:hypothetical protein